MLCFGTSKCGFGNELPLSALGPNSDEIRSWMLGQALGLGFVRHNPCSCAQVMSVRVFEKGREV